MRSKMYSFTRKRSVLKTIVVVYILAVVVASLYAH